MKRRVIDGIGKGIIIFTSVLTVVLIAIMLIHIVGESVPAFREVGNEMFRFDVQWRPVSEHPQYGIMPVVAGTLYTSGIAVIFAMISGIGCAFFLNFYVPKNLAEVFASFIDHVAGIPSVIFGFIGLTVPVKWFALHFEMAAGQCVLVAGIVLGIMLFPFVVSTCSESIQQARCQYELPALALGFSKEVLCIKIIFPAVRQGIIAAAMMAFGRGLGETMAVMMVIGNSPIYPTLLGRGQTIPALTALEMGSIEYGSMHLSVLYAVNVVLLVILVVVMTGGYLLKRRADRYEK